MSAYTLGDVARIFRVSPARLRYFERTELLEPTAVVDSEPRFGFEDLVSVKRLLGLLEQGVALRHIRSGVEAARKRLPDLDQPLGALRASPQGTEGVVIRHGDVLLETDGQVVLDFSEPADGAEGVAALAECGREGLREFAHHKALAWFERGCTLDADRATWGQAIEAYRRAVEADPDFADAHCNLGSIYLNQGRRAVARACFERALGIAPRHLEANLNLASLLEDEGHIEAALHQYKAALVGSPLSADIHLSLALVYEKLHLARRAREHWRRYLGLAPRGSWSEIAQRRLAEAQAPEVDGEGGPAPGEPS